MDTLVLLRNSCLLFLLFSASFPSTSCAGRRTMYMNKLEKKALAATYEGKEQLHHGEKNSIHERLLKANTKDYGTYDPAPTFVKPPFKLIPN